MDRTGQPRLMAGFLQGIATLSLFCGLACTSASVTRNTARVIVATPQTLDFGSILPAVTLQQVVTVSNAGRIAIALKALKILDDAGGVFAVVSSPSSIDPGASASVSVSFTAPVLAGTFNGFLELDSDADNAPALLVRLVGSVGGSCQAVTCPANATCVVTVNGPTCSCNGGFTMQAGICVGVDACSRGNGGCDPNALCTDAPGAVVCTCKPGYQGNGAEGTALVCTLDNPCAIENGGCDPNATCSPVGASVSCTCNPGYTGNNQAGKSLVCTPVDRCLTFNGGCDPNATCTPSGSDVTCACRTGYVDNGQTGTALICVRENPCAVDNGGCDANAFCTPNRGDIICTCKPGYEGNGLTGSALVCTAIDQCLTDNGGCDPNATCTPNGTGVTCACQPGYVGNGQAGTALVCTLQNLCLANNGGCDPHATCQSNGLAVYCACGLGYRGNGRSGTALACTPINLCLTENGGCDPNATCTPNGTSVNCACNPDYIGNGGTGPALVCTPAVDPCSINNGNCDASAKCKSTPAGVVCSCPACYDGNGLTGPALVCTAEACCPHDGPCCPTVMPCAPVPTSLVPPSMNNNHVCEITKYGLLECWGANGSGQIGNGKLVNQSWPYMVLPSVTWKAVGAGQAHTCGVQSDGSLWCWGDNTLGELGQGMVSTTPTLTPRQVGAGLDWTAVSAGVSFSCGLRKDGSLWCWGDNRHGQAGSSSGLSVSTPSAIAVTPGQQWTAVSCGTDFACGLQSDGSLWCWGSNASGNLGNGNAAQVDSATPGRVGTAQYSAVSAGVGYSCAVRSDATLWCWGTNVLNTFGKGSSTGLDTVPVQAAAGSTWVSVAVNINTCAIDYAGSLSCTGPNDYGTLGNGTQTSHMSFTPMGAMWQPWQSVAVGKSTACASTRDNKFFCWGSDDQGQVGSGAPPPDVATQVGPKTTWKSVALGLVRPGNIQIGAFAPEWYVGDWPAAFGVQTNGTLWEWGGYAPYDIELWERQGFAPYDASQLLSQLPAQVGTATNWVSVTAGDPVACALDTGGNLACFGSTNVGDGSSAPTASPVSVGAGPWSTVAVGSFSACGSKAGGALWCWGDNSDGEFGNNTITGSTTPISVGVGNLSNANWSSVSMGATHACGIAAGFLFCWGSNAGGELGNGSTANSTVPEFVLGTPWDTVTAGFSHTCALQPDASLWCWGQNLAGEIGNASTARVATPVQVPGSWTSIVASVSSATTCGIRADGTLWCWGSLAPIVSTGVQPVPYQLGQDFTWSSVAVSGHASGADGVASDVEVCAIRSDDTLWCWGDNSYGQRGNGNAWHALPYWVTL
jgi:alpha-tubulin suppressor-like RCC1 family protein